jgi:hypothetical protein
MTETSGWGAYQNKKKENEILKKQLVVNDSNVWGERISLNHRNEFKNVRTTVNPFRFPGMIKNEEIVETQTQECEEGTLHNTSNIYENKMKENNIIITNLIVENENHKFVLEEKIKNITDEYNKLISTSQIKIDNLKKNNTIMMSIIQLEKDIVHVDVNNVKINNNIIIEQPKAVLHEPIKIIIDESVEDHENDENRKSTNKKRPHCLSECFKIDTLLHHNKSRLNEYGVFVVKDKLIYRCDSNGIITGKETFKSLNSFTCNNYSNKNKLNGTNRTIRNNAYIECFYRNNSTTEWNTCDELKEGVILHR